MKIIYYDCFSGISGDMNLGALLDLGVDPSYLLQELSKLGLEEEYRINIFNDQRKGITGKRVEIKTIYDSHKHDQHKHAQHDLSHSHTEPDHHHSHDNQPNHHHDEVVITEDADNSEKEHQTLREHQTEQVHKTGKEHQSGHEHRRLKDIVQLIESSTLTSEVKQRSLRMFDLLAIAEGKVHGIAKQDVHFHEVGAIDSILDIVGAAICLEYLRVDKIMSSPVELGGGFVKCQHGLFPVPAPAVMELLYGVPVKTGRVQYETTTPTGAVILAANVDQYTESISFRPHKVGYGVGKRDTDIPNVLRAYLGELDDHSASAYGQSDSNSDSKVDIDCSDQITQVVLETNIDDMNPEFYDYVEERLFAQGALDVYKTQIIMKRGRPAVKLSVLSTLENEDILKDIILRETSAIGLRSYKVTKTALERVSRTVDTAYGPIDIKFSYYQGKIIKYKAEYKDCKKVSEQNNLPLDEVYREINRIVDLKYMN